MNSKPSILVVGASGVLGTKICYELVKIYDDSMILYIGDYDQNRGEQTAQQFKAKYCNTSNSNLIELSKKLESIDIVLVAINQQQPTIQKLCMEHNVPCIDITAFYSLTEQVRKLYKNSTIKSTSLVMAGFVPGMSGLLVQKALASLDEIDEVNVSLLQNTNAQSGFSGMVDMLRIISKPVEITINHKKMDKPGFTVKRVIKKSVLGKKFIPRLIDHAERAVLLESFPHIKINYWTGWNVPSFTRLLSFLKKTSLLSLVLKKLNKNNFKKISKHDPVKPEDAQVLVEVEGTKNTRKCKKTFIIKTPSDYGTTAQVAAAMVPIVLKNKQNAVCLPYEITNLDEVLEIIKNDKIEYLES
jgi:saccharopine dehydrogenase-like NADP-dependent oxidoreductase